MEILWSSETSINIYETIEASALRNRRHENIKFQVEENYVRVRPCVGLGLLHEERKKTVNFSRVGSIAPRPTSTIEDQELYFVWPVPFSYLAWVALPGDYAPVGIALRVSVSLRCANLLSKIRW
jgi:hypothetical protein